MEALKTAILLTAGPIGSYSAFIQSGPRNLKTTVTRHQYIDATEQLVSLGLGTNLSNDKPYGRAQVWFVKKTPDQVKEILESHVGSGELCRFQDYDDRYSLPLPKNVNISEEVKQELIDGKYLLHGHESQLLNRANENQLLKY